MSREAETRAIFDFVGDSARMSVGAISGASSSAAYSTLPFANGKKSLDALDAALQAGDIVAAGAAFAQFQSSAIAKRKDADGATAGKVEALGRALGSGDLQAARSAVEDLRPAAAKRLESGAFARLKDELSLSGPAPGGPAGGKGAGGAQEGKSKEAEKKDDEDADTNNDGKVSFQEQVAYEQKLKARAEKEKIEAAKKRAAAAEASASAALGSAVPATGYTPESSGANVAARSGAVNLVA